MIITATERIITNIRLIRLSDPEICASNLSATLTHITQITVKKIER